MTLIGSLAKGERGVRPATYVWGVVRMSEIPGVYEGDWAQIVTDGVYLSEGRTESIENIGEASVYTEHGEVLTLTREYRWEISVRHQGNQTRVALMARHEDRRLGGTFLVLEDGEGVQNEARLVGGELQLRGHRADQMDLQHDRMGVMLDSLMDAKTMDPHAQRRLSEHQTRRGGWHLWRPTPIS